MSHFGGGPADIVLDPTDGGPNTNAHILIYPEDPRVTASSAITGLTDIEGTPLPGYVVPNSVGKVEFLTVNTYSTVYGQDPSGNVYRYDSWESRDDASDIVAQFPEVLDTANEAMVIAQQAAERVVINAGNFATTAQLNGLADATSMFTQAMAQLPNGGRIVAPAGAQLWFDGSSFIELTGHDNLEFDFAGATVFKTTGNGFYNIFNVNGNGTGYGSGVKGITIRNGIFQGKYNGLGSGGASLCLLAANHGQKIRVYDCEFIACMISGHVLDLDGCDDIIVKGCTFRGYNPPTGTVPRGEAIQADISRAGAGAGSAPSFDGLMTRDLRVEDCRFLPWTDPATSIKYPAPCPVGSHATREGKFYANIRCVGIYVEDPAVDNASTGVNPNGIAGDSGDNPYIRGVFHFVSVKGLIIQARIKATDNNGSIRAVMVTSNDYGDLASGDPNMGSTPGAFAAPVISEDIDIDVVVEGMLNPITNLNPLVCLTGVANANTRGAKIKMTLEGGFKEAVYLNRVEDTEIEFVKCANTETGARLINSNNIRVWGNLRNIGLPVRVDNTHHVAIGPMSAQATGAPQHAFITVTNGGDYVTVANLVASGWPLGMYGTVPTNHSEAAVIGPV
jgi:hypothetical protein